jgi:2-amino-4-hydroxy-6-hydroxymethyldihydropteridine diphosphokinase
MQNHKIIIGIGGNIKSENGTHPIKVAIKAISSFKDYSIKVTNQSSWYETEPIPKSEQPNFFNCIVFANTILNELEVLRSLHEIEHKFGRRRRSVNEARVIDLDLIDYSNKILRNKEIIVPHPRAHQRRFVMEPLAELDKNWVHPVLKIKINKILKNLDNQNVKIFNKKEILV